SLRDISELRVLLGKSLDMRDNVYWEYGSPHLSNRHLAIFGSSGQGKTYCIQAILMGLMRGKCNSIIIDYTNGFLSEHLESEFIETVKPKAHIVAQSPLNLSPFRKQATKLDGITILESDYIVASRIASAFKKIFASTGDQQLSLLASTIEEGLKNDGDSFDFLKLFDLLNNKGRIGESVANKISGFIKSNIFTPSKYNVWDEYINSSEIKSNIIQLATIPSSISTIAIEFILWDIYSHASSFGTKNKPIPIVLDEVQNLDLALQSPLGKMLTEGRKYGFSLILATQTLSAFAREDQDRLFLAAHKLFFSPAETELNTYAKLLEQIVPGSTRKDWVTQLVNLQKGECISVGLHRDNFGKYKYGAIVIKIINLSMR
ncbi:TPA: ATP-binding protein, partial [Enterobacter cloacae]